MHEVIDYSKNFITGMTKTVSKQKKDTPYTGVATIQIYDENNNIVQEVKSTNFITNAMLSKMYNDLFRLPLIKNRRSTLTEMLYNGMATPAYWMVLTDYASQENVNETTLYGNVIGYADGWNAYSGSDKSRGTINLSETSNGEWSKHFVVDFPTHAANGTFRSICWMPFVNDYFGTYAVNSENICSGLGTTTYGFCANASFAFSAYAGDMTKIHKINLATKEKTILAFTKSVCSLSCDETNLFVLHDDGTIYKYDLDGTLISSCFQPTLTNGVYYVSMLYMNNQIIIYDRNNYNGAIPTISFYDVTGTKLKSYNMTFSDVYFMYPENENEIFLVRGQRRSGAHLFNINTGDVYSYKKFIVVGDSETSIDRDISGISKVGDELLISFYGALLRCTTCDIFSRTLLPEPITKTSANTMKIQYDFNVAPRGYFEV